MPVQEVLHENGTKEAVMRPSGIIAAFILAALCTLPVAARQDRGGDVIQMAILLDTSSSMDGLIGQAKTQLWKIVNELSQARRDGRSPRLEIALYEYGKSSIPRGEGYIRMILPFTTELDRVSEELFALTTNGGDEYCGQVIDAALKGLKWSEGRGELKVIFIAGNEPFTQGEFDYTRSVRDAASRGITVNTIFCGSYEEGVDTKWKHGAELSNGRYMNIDHNEKIVAIRAPQDDEIKRLGAQLNQTYLAYGRGGAEKKERQAMQDKNAALACEESIVERSVAKASRQYDNSGWDLLDAMRDGRVKLDSMEKEDLPAEMKSMSPTERAAYCAEMEKKRQKLQARINTLNEQRRAYVAQEMKKNTAGDTLDSAIVRTVREQAGEKNYRFK